MAEPALHVTEIQGDVLAGLIKKTERLFFFAITEADAFRSFLRDLEITSTDEVPAQKALIAERKADGIATLVPTKCYVTSLADQFEFVQVDAARARGGGPSTTRFLRERRSID